MNVRPFLLVALLAVTHTVHAQAKPAPAVAAEATPAEVTERAWNLLTTTVADTKHVDNVIQALAALGLMGNDTRAAQLIMTTMKDPELDIRTAAILAAGQTKNPKLLPALRDALEDAEPQVSFTAAVTLWKLHDHAGQDILVAVMDGDRRANATLGKGARHSLNRDLHNPAAIAKIGATQGAALLLGPFGFGISAIEYARKNGGDSARAESIELLSDMHTAEVHSELVDALTDKDTAVRAAAAKALSHWSDAATAKALAPLIDDPKLPVRLTAAAAYLRASSSPHRTTTRAKP